jgi:uncharacterized membrane protein
MSIRIPVRHAGPVALAYVAGALVYPSVPEGTPLRPMVAFLLPTTALLLYLLLGGLWRRDPIRPRDEPIEATYDAIVFRIVLFVVAVQMIVVVGLLDAAGVIMTRWPWLLRALPVSLGLALVAIGNLLPRMKPNVVIGIRTSRALADSAVWSQINRMAGYVGVALGAVLVVSGAVLSKQTGAGVVSIAALAGCVVLVVYSFKVRGDNHRARAA